MQAVHWTVKHCAQHGRRLRLRNPPEQATRAPHVCCNQPTTTQRPRAPRPVSAHADFRNADDQPGEHDPSKGVDHHSRRGPLKEPMTAAAAQAAETVDFRTEADVPSAPAHQEPAEDVERGVSYYAADEDTEDGAEPANLDELVGLLERRLALGGDKEAALLGKLKREPVLPSLDLAGVAQLIKSGRAKRIIAMCGAGISVSAGIPDFRTPGTGLYSQLERFGLPEPEAVFSISFFKKNPKPFHMLAKELFPGNYKPTLTHHFMKLLHDKGLLLRCFTQNIDSLEHEAGLPKSAVVAAHGNFDSAHCIKCHKEHMLDHVKQAVFGGGICYCTKCGGLVKPDIVFFGEQLPDRFYERMQYDFPTCDLLLVMGTSLVVQPFASLVDAVPASCPRVLINRERVGEGMGGMGIMASLLGYGGGGGFIFDEDDGAYRDVLYLGDSDDGVQELAQLLGWEQELLALSGSSSSSSSSVARDSEKQQSATDAQQTGISSNSSSSQESRASREAGKLIDGDSGTAGKL